jgi:hypothetical protein
MVHLPAKTLMDWRADKVELTAHLGKLCYDTWGMSRGALDLGGNKFGTVGMAHLSQRQGMLDYLSKAMNPDEKVQLGGGVMRLSEFLGIEPEDQALVPVKRVGWSRNIGEAARQKVGFNDTDDLLRLSEQVRGIKAAATVEKRRRATVRDGRTRSNLAGSA